MLTRIDLQRVFQLHGLRPMSLAFTAVLLLLSSLAFNACGEATINPNDPNNPNEPSPDPSNPFADLQNQQWRLYLVIFDENGWVTPPSSAVYTFEFVDDSTCRGTAACKLFSAPYTASKDDKLVDVIEPEYSLENCQDELTDTYLEMLRDVTNYRISETELELYFVDPGSGQERSLIFRKAEDQLFRIKPVLISYNDADVGSLNSGVFELLAARIVAIAAPMSEYLLEIEVSYSGGCEEHIFQVRQAPTVTLNLNEMQLAVVKNDIVDSCDGVIRETHRFSLAGLSTVIKRFNIPTEGESETTIKLSGGVPLANFTLTLPQ